MGMASVNTNVGAMLALQNLSNTNNELSQVQNRINTGRNVASAKDNGAIFAIATGQRAEIGALNAVKSSLSRGQSVTDVSLAAGESVSDLLSQLKEKALAATDATLATSARAALNEDFTSIRDQISTVVSNASFNGVNLLDNSNSAGFAALSNTTGATIAVKAENMSLSGSIVVLGVSSSLEGLTNTVMLSNSKAALSDVNSSIANVSAALARLGTGSKALETHNKFISKLQDSLEEGVGNLVDADLAKESARLQSLQTKQQLGAQSLSIANQSSSMLLGLFR